MKFSFYLIIISISIVSNVLLAISSNLERDATLGLIHERSLKKLIDLEKKIIKQFSIQGEARIEVSKEKTVGLLDQAFSRYVCAIENLITEEEVRDIQNCVKTILLNLEQKFDLNPSIKSLEQFEPFLQEMQLNEQHLNQVLKKIDSTGEMYSEQILTNFFGFAGLRPYLPFLDKKKLSKDECVELWSYWNLNLSQAGRFRNIDGKKFLDGYPTAPFWLNILLNPHTSRNEELFLLVNSLLLRLDSHDNTPMHSLPWWKNSNWQLQ